MVPSRKMALLGGVALMENDGNRDKHPCLSDRKEKSAMFVLFKQQKTSPIINHLSELKLESNTKTAASTSHHERWLLHSKTFESQS